jgi:hypothetical protein
MSPPQNFIDTESLVIPGFPATGRKPPCPHHRGFSEDPARAKRPSQVVKRSLNSDER